MTDWLARARCEIPEAPRQVTAKTDERVLTAVMAVPHPQVSEIPEGEDRFPGQPDDRHPCRVCAHLSSRGLCMAAWRGDLPGPRRYEPERHLPRRCAYFVLSPNPLWEAPEPEELDARGFDEDTNLPIDFGKNGG